MISFVVVEYNSVEEVRGCLSSVLSGGFKERDCEVVVSSNSCYGSDYQAELASSMPEVRWVFNEKNGGFAYAMNRGLAAAKGDVLVIMNPDCKIIGGVKDMAAYLLQNESVGAIGPRVIGHDGIVQDTARRYVTLQRFVRRQMVRVFTSREAVSEYDCSKLQCVDWLAGAFIMLKRSVYEQIGGLDEEYFMYSEDVDWCTRIRAAGYNVVYYPEAEVEYSGTRRARTDKKYAKIFLKSLLRLWRKFGCLSDRSARKCRR